eukprot:2671635-Pyramimonas_sp.AAC.1
MRPPSARGPRKAPKGRQRGEFSAHPSSTRSADEAPTSCNVEASATSIQLLRYCVWGWSTKVQNP